MTGVLSPDQIAVLVAAAKDGDMPATEPARARRSRRVREIDFSRPAKLGPDEQRRFERAHESFCRAASTRLSNDLRSTIEFEIINFAQLTWTRALRDVPQPAIFGVGAADPLGTSIAIGLEQSLVFRMIERLMGGGDRESSIDRSPTEIELALARRIFGSLFSTLSVVWDELLGLTLALVNIEAQSALESQSATAELVQPSEPTLVLTLESRDQVGSSTVSILVPYSSIEAASKRLSRMYANDEIRPPEGDIEAVRTTIGTVEIELRAEVGATELTIAEVQALAEGDVIRLGVEESAGVFLYAGENRLTHARPGRSGGHRAVQVIEQLTGLT